MTRRTTTPLARIRILAAALTLLFACGTGVVLARRAPPEPSVCVVAVGRGPIAIAVDSRLGRVFVANHDDASLSVLDAHTGAVRDTIALGQYPTALVVDEADVRVITLNSIANKLSGPEGTIPGSVSVLDGANGRLVRTVMAGASPSALAVDAPSHHIFVADSVERAVRMFDARNGNVLRSTALDGIPQSLAVDEQSARLFVSTQNGPLAAVSMLDTRSGALLSTRTVGHAAGPVVVDARTGRAFVGGDSGLVVLDARSEQIVGTRPEHVLPLLVDEPTQRILVQGPAGLRLLDTRSGQRRGPMILITGGPDLPPSWDVSVAADAVNGQIVVVLPSGDVRQQGRLYALDGRTGRVLRHLPAGTEPVAVAVDAATHHVFVVQRGAAEQPVGLLHRDVLIALSHRLLQWLPLLGRTLRVPDAGSVIAFDLHGRA